MKKIVIATKNPGKVREMMAAFAGLDVVLVSLAEYGDIPDAVEDGTTFTENALIKARFYAQATGCACLADDSGLEIDLLDGAPGVYSARFAGEQASDAANNEKMVQELRQRSAEQSPARYRCVLALVDGDAELLADGSCEGVIRTTAAGSGGFGYDPYFYLPELDRTMAEITLAEKNAVSHRGRALRSMAAQLAEVLR